MFYCNNNSNTDNNTQCSTRLTKEKCKEKEECVFVMNSYSNMNHSECLKLNNVDLVKKFCGIFWNMNKGQGFNPLICESSLYNHKAMISDIDGKDLSSATNNNYLMLLMIMIIFLI